MSTATSANARVVKYLKTIGIVNNVDNGRGFAEPYDLAISADGRIFVLNRCDPARAKGIRVGICNLNEDYLGEFGDGKGHGDTQFDLPAAMAFDSKDRLHIVDEGHHRVTIFDSSGTFMGKWGSFGSNDGQFNGPSGIVFDSFDNVYIADQHNNRIQKLDQDGNYLLQWGNFGCEKGQFNMPWGLAVDNKDNVYVADWRNDRVQKFTSDGQFMAVIGESGTSDGQFSRPSGVDVDDEDNIYIADWGNERVQVLGPDGSFLQKLRGQATLSKWAEEFFAANPDEMNERVKSNLIPELPSHLRDPYDESSQTESYFWGPISVKLDCEGRLYVLESNRHRFQIYDQV